MITEDIDISWKLQMDHWDIRYEPNAMCWILMPETLKGLWKQRVRWAQGGAEVLLKYFKRMWNWKKRRMWPVFLEYAVSVFWAYLLTTTVVLWIISKLVYGFSVATGFDIVWPELLRMPSLMPGWNGIVLAFTCLLQFVIAMIIDGRYEKGMGKNYYWMIWYPLVYWCINVGTTIVAFPKAVFKKSGERAVWVSPDRGMTG